MTRSTFNAPERDIFGISHAPLKKLTLNEKSKKLSSPYAIRNLTPDSIKVTQIDSMGNKLMKDACDQIMPYDIVKLVKPPKSQQSRPDSERKSIRQIKSEST